MKRFVIFAIACLLISIFPIKAYADFYEKDGLTIYFNENNWLVVTKDSVNDDLSEYGIEPGFVEQLFDKNKDLFIDAVKLEDNSDFIVRISDSNGMPDLSTLSEEELEGEYLDTLKRESGSSNCYIDELGGYTYGVADYQDEKTGYYLFEFVTIQGGKQYCFTAQSSESFWRSDKDELIRMMDEDVQIDLSAASSSQDNTEPKGLFDWGKIIVAGVLGGIFGLIGIVFGKTKTRKRKTETSAIVSDAMWAADPKYGKAPDFAIVVADIDEYIKHIVTYENEPLTVLKKKKTIKSFSSNYHYEENTIYPVKVKAGASKKETLYFIVCERAESVNYPEGFKGRDPESIITDKVTSSSESEKQDGALTIEHNKTGTIIDIGRLNSDHKGSSTIPVNDLRQLKILHEEGVLTDEEYEAKKKQLLNI